MANGASTSKTWLMWFMGVVIVPLIFGSYAFTYSATQTTEQRAEKVAEKVEERIGKRLDKQEARTNQALQSLEERIIRAIEKNGRDSR